MAHLVCDEMIERSVHRVRRLELAMRIGRREETGTALIVNIDPSHIDSGQPGDESDFIAHFFEWAQGGHREKVKVVLAPERNDPSQSPSVNKTRRTAMAAPYPSSFLDRRHTSPTKEEPSRCRWLQEEIFVDRLISWLRNLSDNRMDCNIFDDVSHLVAA